MAMTPGERREKVAEIVRKHQMEYFAFRTNLHSSQWSQTLDVYEAAREIEALFGRKEDDNASN